MTKRPSIPVAHQAAHAEPMTYRERIIDAELDKLLPALAAIVLGP